MSDISQALLGHPLPWRQGDILKGERPWCVLDADGALVISCSVFLAKDRSQSIEHAAKIVAAANVN